MVDALGLGPSGEIRGGSSPLLSTLQKKPMKINLWYSQPSRQWRWTLTDDKEPMSQESGSQPFLRDAMDDVANTVEYMLECSQNE